MMDPVQAFQQAGKQEIAAMGQDADFKALSTRWMQQSVPHKYSYHFQWMGRPIIQYPGDVIAMQEIIWDYQPDLIIETGIAHGGSLVYYASLLELIGNPEAYIVGIDVDIRPHNREALEQHPMAHRIRLMEGSSVAMSVLEEVKKHVSGKQRILVILDSNHTHDHVLQELILYSPFVKKDGYLIVFDTIVEDLAVLDDENVSTHPEGANAAPRVSSHRPWGAGNNPKTAVWEFLKTNDRFVIDSERHDKLSITVAPDGYLKCVKDPL